MNDTSRRKFLAATSATAAVGAAGAVGLAGSAAATSGARLSGTSARDRVVAVVEDHRGDALTLLVGDREVVVRDRDLVTRILNAAGGQ